jgi:hypothetical protein
MDFDSAAGDLRPNPKRPRRRRWYLLAVIPVIAVVLTALAASRIFSGGSCHLIGFEPEPYSSVGFDLAPALAKPARPIHVRACVPSSCAFITVKKLISEPLTGPGVGSDWLQLGPRYVVVKDPSLTLEPITVRVTMTDQAGNPIFDSSAQVQPQMFEPNGPGCSPTWYEASVEATYAGRLVQEA